jgi:hypothetical protein
LIHFIKKNTYNKDFKIAAITLQAWSSQLGTVVYGEGVDFAFVEEVGEESLVLRDGNRFKYLH